MFKELAATSVLLAGMATLIHLPALASANVPVEVCGATVINGEVYRGDCDLYSVPACQFEDGNPDGSACAWTDPDTGAVFYVESHNYGTGQCSDICLGALQRFGGVR